MRAKKQDPERRGNEAENTTLNKYPVHQAMVIVRHQCGLGRETEQIRACFSSIVGK